MSGARLDRRTGRLVTGGGSYANGAPKGGVSVCDECHRPSRRGLAEGERFWCSTCHSRRLNRAGLSVYGPLTDGPRDVPSAPHPTDCGACRVRPAVVGAAIAKATEAKP